MIIPINATQESTRDLTKLNNFFGGKGGVIVTKEQSRWGNLRFDTQPKSTSTMMSLSLFKLKGRHAPLQKINVPNISFLVKAKMDDRNNNIEETQIITCQLFTPQEIIQIDDDVLHEHKISSHGIQKKDYTKDTINRNYMKELQRKCEFEMVYDLDLTKMFASFMDNISHKGPYLTDPFLVSLQDPATKSFTMKDLCSRTI